MWQHTIATASVFETVYFFIFCMPYKLNLSFLPSMYYNACNIILVIFKIVSPGINFQDTTVRAESSVN